MNLLQRIKRLEIDAEAIFPKSGCNITLLIVTPEHEKGSHFDYVAYKPTHEEMDKYLKYLKESGQCTGCQGSCALNWEPGGFKYHTLQGKGRSNSSEPSIFTIHCIDEETTMSIRHVADRTELRSE